MEIKKVLILAFIYPPLGGSGVQRTLKFSKYLPEFGWQPYLVCNNDPEVFGCGLDPSLLEDVPPEAHVWRKDFINPLSLRRWIQKRFSIQTKSGINNSLVRSTASEANSPTQKVAPGRFRRILSLISRLLSPFEFPPVDAALYWNLAIIPGCLRLIREEKIDLIFSTSFPYSDHVSGLLLKKLTRLPWVADFRDPWTQNTASRNSGWRYMIDRRVEQLVLKNADRVIGVTPSYTRNLHGLCPGRQESNFITIENGYDLQDFCKSKVKARQPDGKTRLAHVGQVYDGTALPFLQALELIGETGASLNVRFIGGLAPQEQTWLEKHSIHTVVQVEPRLNHIEAVEAMSSADVLLLFVLDESVSSGHYPGKLFEYMASEIPILLVGTQGDAAELLQSSGSGICIPANEQAVLGEILKMIAIDPDWFKQKYYNPRFEVIKRYERSTLTEKLAAVFELMTYA